MTPETTCCFSGHRPPRLPWGSNEADPPLPGAESPPGQRLGSSI